MVNISPGDRIPLYGDSTDKRYEQRRHKVVLSKIWNICFLHLPILGWLPKYTFNHLQCDLIAGITVGLMVLPQALAYASIARLSNEYGLFSSFMGVFMYTIFGTSKDVTIGPTSILSLMTATYNVPHCADTAIALSLYTGIILLAMGLFRLGFLVRFVSIPVISAFTSAAAITIACGQLKDWNGLAHVPRDFFGNLSYIFKHIRKWNLYDLAFGLACVFILCLMRLLPRLNRIKPDTPTYSRVLRKIAWFCGIGKNAIVVILSCVLMYVFSLYGINHKFSLIKNINAGLPPFQPVTFPLRCNTNLSSVDDETISQSLGSVSFTESIKFFSTGLVIVPLLAVMEAMAIGKAFARVNNYKIIPTQELVALGMANIAGSFVSGYPVTGSFSRTAVNSQSGVKTPLAGLFSGTIVIIATQYLTQYFTYIPKACLGSVIICAVINMVDVAVVRSIWKVNRLDIIPYVITFLGCFYTLETGLLLGIAASMVILLKSSVSPPLNIVGGEGEVCVIEVKNGVLFPGVEKIINKVDELMAGGSNGGGRGATLPLAVVLDVKNVAEIDYTVAAELHEFVFQMRRKTVNPGTGTTDFWIINASFNVKRILLMADLQDALTTWDHIKEDYIGSRRRVILP